MTALGALLAATLLFGGAVDAGAVTGDAGPNASDAAVATADAASPDAARPDGGSPDAARPDAGAPDAGPPAAAVQAPPAPKLPVGHVVGHVLAAGGHEVVPDAALSVGGAAVGVTNEVGDFTIELPCGQHALSIRAAGFDPLVTSVDACASSVEPVTVHLIPMPDRPRRETIVRVKVPQPQIQLTGPELTQTPGALGDPLRVIESLPGVAAVAWPAPVYAVRGSNPGNTGFFLDGIEIPALFHFALGPSVIHPYFFRSVDFFPGSYPARYGRYVGGIVSAETRAPSMDDVHMSVDARLYDVGAMVSAPLAGGAVAAAARYSYSGELVSLLDEHVILNYWDYQVRADRRVGPFQLTVFAFGSGDEFSPSPSNSAKTLDLGFHRLSLRAALPAGGGMLKASVVLGTDHSRAPVLDVYPIIVDSKSVAPRLSYDRTFGPVQLALGFDGHFARYEPVVLGGATLPADSDWDFALGREATLLAGYLSATVNAGQWLTITPEVRLDSYAEGGARAHDLGPRLTIAAALNDETKLRATGGHFTQLPSLPLEIPGMESFGLALLGLQSSWQGSVGVETSHFAAVDLSITGFIHHDWLTDLRSVSALSPDPLADDFLARREALAYGVELLARRSLTKRLHGWISYTLSKSLRDYGGGAVGPTDWDQRHILNLVAGYRVGRYELGGRVHFNTGRPIFIQDPAGDQYKRLPAYYQLDLRVDRPVYYNRFTLDVYAELVNALLDSAAYTYTRDPNNALQAKSYRIVLPSIGVRAEF